MRILVCNWKDLSHPAAGGAEVYVESVARQWVDWGHEVTLFCSAVDGRPPDEEVGGVHVRRRGSRFGVYREASRYYRSEGRGRFDVVLDVVNTRPFLTPAYVHDATVVALIFQVAREVWSYEVPWPAAELGRRWLEPRWLRRYASVPTLTISESSRESLQAYGLGRISMVPVGHEPSGIAQAPLREANPTVVFLGRLAANKRPDHALRAFRTARSSLPDARMWVIGDGPMSKSLRHEFGADPVRFFGRAGDTEKLDLLARCHALVVTSVREGWGMVVTEAAGVGTPAIGYDVPGLRDSLRASGGVAVGESVEEMAHAVSTLVPRWISGGLPVVAPRGVAPWADVATAVLDHLQRERHHAGR